MTTESISYHKDDEAWYSGRVAVIVATFGDGDWADQGDEVAGKLDEQTVRPIIVRSHSEWSTLTEVRNSAALSIRPGVVWLVFLDADDELDSQFVEELHAYDGEGDILQTSVRGFVDSGRGRQWIEPFPVLHRQKFPLSRQNYLTVGSPIRRELFEKVGGFDEWPVLEDWALWLKCYREGAKFDELPEACYYINDNHTRNVSRRDADDIARQIRATY